MRDESDTGLGVIKHLIERLQSKEILGVIFRAAVRKFLTLNQFEYEIFCNPNAEQIVAERYKKIELHSLFSKEAVEKMTELDFLQCIVDQIKKPTFNDAPEFRSAVIKLLNMKGEELGKFVGPLPKDPDKDERLDREFFLECHKVGLKHAMASPGTDGVDG
jgi:hypothetical protein